MYAVVFGLLFPPVPLLLVGGQVHEQVIMGTAHLHEPGTLGFAVASVVEKAGTPAPMPTLAESIEASSRHCGIPSAAISCGPEPPFRPEFGGFSPESAGWTVVHPSSFAYLEDEPGWSTVIKPYGEFCRDTPPDLTEVVFGTHQARADLGLVGKHDKSTAVRIGPAQLSDATATVQMESEMTGVFFDAVWEGPAMLSGTVTETVPGKYAIVTNLTDVGEYTLRVTLMYEHSWYAYGPSKEKQAFYSQADGWADGKENPHLQAKPSWSQPHPLCRPLLVEDAAAIGALKIVAKQEDTRLKRVKTFYDIPGSLLPTYTNAFKPGEYGTLRLLTEAGMKKLKRVTQADGPRYHFPRLQDYEVTQRKGGNVFEIGSDAYAGIVRAEFKLAVHTLATVSHVVASAAVLGGRAEQQQLKPCRGFGIDVPAHERADYGRWVMTPNGPVWRPLGCIAKVYQPDDIAACIARTPMVVVGDSHSRELDEELKQSLVIAEIGRCSTERPVKLPLGRNYMNTLLDYHTNTSADSKEQLACKKKSGALTKQASKSLGFVRLCHFGTNAAVANWKGMYNWSVAFLPDHFERQVVDVRNHAFHRKLKFIIMSVGSWSAVGMDAEQIFDQWKIFIDMLLDRLWKDEARAVTLVWRSQAAYGHRRGPNVATEHRTNAKISKLWARQKTYIEELQVRDKDHIRAAGLTRPRIVAHDDFNAMLPFFHNTADTTHFARFGTDDWRHDWEWPTLNGRPGGACGGGVGEDLECPFGNRGSNAVGMSTANSLLNSICAPDE
jgi:hypothetical protein